MISIIKKKHSESLLREISVIALDKETQKELKYPINSSEKHIWYLAYYNKELIGFCSVIDKEDYCVFSHDYVVKYYRGLGAYNMMFENRLNDCVKNIKSTCTNNSIYVFLKNGFKIKRKTKNYNFVEKTIICK